MKLESGEKINILLKEYDTLRQEILSRMNNRFLMLGLLGTFLAFVLFTDSSVMKAPIFGLSARVIMAISGVVALLATWLYFGYLVGTLARRVSAIEQRINQLAGEELLEWETRHGWGRWGKFSGAKRDAT